MSITIQTPNITAQNDREKLLQMQSYLYRMAQQLQWAFSTLETGTTGVPQAAAAQLSGKGQAAPENPKATFAGLKDLIIKSAEIVEAYYETISKKLEGQYVAQSDFGTYAEQTRLELEASSQNIRQLYSNEQIILSGMEALNGSTAEISGKVGDLTEQGKQLGDSLEELYRQTLQTTAYIKSGLLYYAEDGTPVYGLEIGQTNSLDGQNVFDKFARFAADRLSFFDRNDVEVAYISDYKLYITNAEITGSLWLSGRFKIYYNGGLAFQWTGGEN